MIKEGWAISSPTYKSLNVICCLLIVIGTYAERTRSARATVWSRQHWNDVLTEVESHKTIPPFRDASIVMASDASPPIIMEDPEAIRASGEDIVVTEPEVVVITEPEDVVTEQEVFVIFSMVTAATQA
jgi:hypothetical protein